MPDIQIYTQPWCPFCERAVHLLGEQQAVEQDQRTARTHAVDRKLRAA